MSRAVFQLPNTFNPKQGPVGIQVPLDLRTVTTLLGDLVAEQMQSQIEFVQSIFIDNRFNPNPLAIEFIGLGYVIQARAQTQGVYPVITGSGPLRFSAASNNAGAAINLIIPTIMFNVVLPYSTWQV